MDAAEWWRNGSQRAGRLRCLPYRQANSFSSHKNASTQSGGASIRFINCCFSDSFSMIWQKNNYKSQQRSSEGWRFVFKDHPKQGGRFYSWSKFRFGPVWTECVHYQTPHINTLFTQIITVQQRLTVLSLTFTTVQQKKQELVGVAFFLFVVCIQKSEKTEKEFKKNLLEVSFGFIHTVMLMINSAV